jgi:4-amino-4-deoxy-L-arabinose transferase-like glycosyltransferase
MKKTFLLPLAEMILVLLLCCFPLFRKLDALPIRQWDEARNAVSALEMINNGNYLVRYFDGRPDYFDVKPPLLIWLQAASIKLLGPDEMAVRLPSALAALLTAAFLIFYFAWYQGDRLAGYIAAAVLVTSQGYIDRHLARTGDHDAILVLLTTLIIFLYYEFLCSPGRRLSVIPFYLSMAVVLAVLLKGVAVMMIMPGLLIMTFLTGAHKELFRNRWFYAGLFLLLLTAAAYYGARESLQPGYLEAVWKGEMLPRYFNGGDSFIKESSFYYIKNFAGGRFSYWLFLLVPAILLFSWNGFGDKKSFSFYLLINTLVFLLIISAGTYNIWYDGPLYPLMASLTAIFITGALVFLQKKIFVKPLFFRAAKAVIICVIFIYPFAEIMKKVARTSEFYWDEETYAMCYELRDYSGSPRVDAVVFDGYAGHLLFYIERIRMLTGREIILKSPGAAEPGDYVMTSQQKVSDYLMSTAVCEQVYKKGRTCVLLIKERSD